MRRNRRGATIPLLIAALAWLATGCAVENGLGLIGGPDDESGSGSGGSGGGGGDDDPGGGGGRDNPWSHLDPGNLPEAYFAVSVP